LDIDRVFEAAAKNRIILEINSHPDRLDINAELARRAHQLDIKVSINSDAHHKNDLKLVKYGVLNARRGWLEKADVINTRSREDVIKYFRQS
jgi:DNA polymerase (family 10)